jgi:hypothetical protein
VFGLSENNKMSSYFRKGPFSVKCLVDRVKHLSGKWFQGKNPDSPYSFYEWDTHPTFMLVSCWISMDQGDWRSTFYFVLHVVDLCLSLLGGILLVIGFF